MDPTAFVVLSAGVFAGAVVSGLAGFAFSAVAGAILLHLLPPVEAVPLMMACSLVVQGISLTKLRHTVQWRSSPMLMAGGALGVLPALYLLHHIDAGLFRMGFGIFLAGYAACMLLRPAGILLRATQGGLRHAAVGFGGGLIGGLTAMPGALPVIWCDLRGMPKEQQRGLVQPYITVMQVFALALLLSRYGISNEALWNLTLSLPALLAGTALGMLLFGKINDAWFRRVVLAILLVAGLTLAI
ncbi:MAG TPA: sulfite exporter TauE/SafE family protein [Hyphomicrobiaceae bacterium]|nr:sulfite exporter TauE/SafE family protein [Hyphomicrobiaceae bacterium]